MKKNISVLISAILFLTYEVYIAYRYVWFYLNRDKYGNVFKDILIIPHFSILLVGIIFNIIYFFKPLKWVKYTTIICYLIGALYLFI